MFIGGCAALTMEKMENFFDKDYDLLSEMVTYMTNLEYESISINNKESSEMSVDSSTRIAIEDTDIIKVINKLKSLGYSTISKGDNAISFLRWSNMDNGRGVVYSIDGNEPSSDYTLPFLTKLEPLSKPNWYYYEEDYNEWRIREQSKQ